MFAFYTTHAYYYYYYDNHLAAIFQDRAKEHHFYTQITYYNTLLCPQHIYNICTMYIYVQAHSGVMNGHQKASPH